MGKRKTCCCIFTTSTACLKIVRSGLSNSNVPKGQSELTFTVLKLNQNSDNIRDMEADKLQFLMGLRRKIKKINKREKHQRETDRERTCMPLRELQHVSLCECVFVHLPRSYETYPNKKNLFCLQILAPLGRHAE